MKILKPEDVAQFPEPRRLSPEELAEAYRMSREAFTAEDLQRYTELSDGVLAEEVLRELEELEKQMNEPSQ
jgi:hypothetical protein